jgi:hypothetical protein
MGHGAVAHLNAAEGGSDMGRPDIRMPDIVMPDIRTPAIARSTPVPGHLPESSLLRYYPVFSRRVV